MQVQAPKGQYLSLTADIFRNGASGLVWIEAAANVELAKARIEELAASAPGEYVILCQKTGNKLTVRVTRTRPRGEHAYQPELRRAEIVDPRSGYARQDCLAAAQARLLVTLYVDHQHCYVILLGLRGRP